MAPKAGADSADQENEESLVAHWDFNEGSGTRLRDQSGNGNDGRIVGATYVPHGDGYALEFDGQGAHVSFEDQSDFNLGETFTLEVWMQPSLDKENHSQAVVMGKSITDYALTFNPLTDAAYLFVARRNARGGLHLGQWNHVIGVFDEDEARIYVNGREAYYRRGRNIDSEARARSQSEFLIGASSPGETVAEVAGRSFKGRIAEAAVFNRAMDEAEIRDRYAGSNLTGAPEVLATRVPPLGVVAVDVNTHPLGDLPEQARLRVELQSGGAPVAVEEVEQVRSRSVVPVEFDSRELGEGVYTVSARVLGPEDQTVGRAGDVRLSLDRKERFPEQTPHGKRLNNLVTELLHLEGAEAESGIHAFHLPKEGWIFAAVDLDLPEGASVELVCRYPDGTEQTWITATADQGPPPWAGSGNTWEAMHELSAGEYELLLRREGGGGVERMVVRAVPDLVLNNLASNELTRDGQERGPDYYATRGLRYCNGVFNAIRAQILPDHRAFIEEWQAAGRKALVNARLPHPPHWEEEEMTAENIADWWLNDYYAEGLDGIVCDEIHWRTQYAEAYAGATRIFHEHTNASVGIYTGDVFRYPAWTPYLQASMDTGGQLFWEWYFTDRPTTLSAWLFLRQNLGHAMTGWREAMDQIDERLVPNTVLLIGGFTLHHRRTHHIWPQSDWNVYMDMMMHEIANNPDYDGIGGVSFWRVNYLEEERVRWIAQLFRHYFIEGNRERFGEIPYQLRHVRNPGFEAGLDGWTIATAEDGEVRAGISPGFGTLLGLAPQDTGDEVAILRRSSSGPNTLSQTLTGLVPGQLYAVTLVASDANDVTRREEHALSLDIQGGEVVEEESYRRLFTNQVWTSVYYPERNHGWMSYVRKVFRADDTEGTLTLSDWADQETPGGPEGQELMIGYIQVRPYLEAEPE